MHCSARRSENHPDCGWSRALCGAKPEPMGIAYPLCGRTVVTRLQNHFEDLRRRRGMQAARGWSFAACHVAASERVAGRRRLSWRRNLGRLRAREGPGECLHAPLRVPRLAICGGSGRLLHDAPQSTPVTNAQRSNRRPPWCQARTRLADHHRFAGPCPPRSRPIRTWQHRPPVTLRRAP